MKGCPVKDKIEWIWKEALVTLAWYCPRDVPNKTSGKTDSVQISTRTYNLLNMKLLRYIYSTQLGEL